MDLPITLRPSRAGQLLLILISVAFTVGGAWMIRDREAMGYFVTGFFGLCLIISVVASLPGSSWLRLTDEGFTFRSLYRTHSIRWSDVERFGVATVGGRPMVAWQPRQDGRPEGLASRVSREICGFEAALPDTYGLKPDELAALLAVLRDQFAGDRDHQTADSPW